jgi:hypothetical protein
MDPAYEAKILNVLQTQGVIALAEQFEVGRYLDKLGCLDTDEEMLRFIAPQLNEADVLALYSYFKSFRLEWEWREQFENIFPEHTDALPEPDLL